MIADALAQYVAAEHADLTYTAAAGGNMFLDDMPAGPERAVAVFNLPGYQGDPSLPYDKPSVQFQIRGTRDPRTAYAWALDIYNMLHGLHDVELPGGIWLVSLFAVQSGPVRIGPDSNGRMRYTVNFDSEIKNPVAGNRIPTVHP